MLEQRGFKVEVQAAGRRRRSTPAWPRAASTSRPTPGCPTTHAQYWKKYKDKLEDLGAWYGKTSLELAVPSYMKGVDSLDDLKGKAGTVRREDHRHRARAPARWACCKDKVLKEYGLDGRVQGRRRLHARHARRAGARVRQEGADRRHPVVAALGVQQVRPDQAQGPQGRLGQGRRHAHAGAARASPTTNPQVAKWLKNFKMTEKQLTSLEATIQNAGKGKEQEAVRAWLKEQPGHRRQAGPGRQGRRDPPRARTRGDAPNIGFPVGRGHRRHVPVEERPGEARLQAEAQAVRRRPDVHRDCRRGQIDVEFDGWLPSRRRSTGTSTRTSSSTSAPGTTRPHWRSPSRPTSRAWSPWRTSRARPDTFKGKIIGIEPGTGEMKHPQEQGPARLRPGQGVQGRRRLHARRCSPS